MPDNSPAPVRVIGGGRAGCEVVIPQDFGCCGALTLHMGLEADGKACARNSIALLLAAEAEGPVDAIIINTSGCGTTIKDYGHLFTGDAVEAEARRVSALARDVTEFMAQLGLPATADQPGRLPRLDFLQHPLFGQTTRSSCLILIRDSAAS